MRGAQDSSLQEYLLTVLAPGLQGLDLKDCIIAADPKCTLAPRPGDSTPVSMSVLRYLDVVQENIKLEETQELADELAAIFSLATERRIIIPKTQALRIEGSQRVTFIAYGAAVDRRLHGPAPENLETTIHDLLSKFAGLPPEARPVLGAAAKLHHSAVEIFENDLRAAYLLLVAGIELLSREFGSPPIGWCDWEGSEAWEKTFEATALSEEQRSAVRSQLMIDKQLRLKATFREYASTRLPESFWDEPWESWIHTYNASEGKWLEAPPYLLETRKMCDILHRDRKSLSQLLGRAYDIRSALVHRGELLMLIDNAVGFAATADSQRPLAFPVLRSVLRCLIKTEVEALTKPVALPSFRFPRPIQAKV